MVKKNNLSWFLNILTVLAFLGVGMLLSACASPLTTSEKSVFASQTTTPTITSTVIWFPVTATPTTAPTETPTPNPASTPVYGSLLFSDPFSGDTPWKNEQNANGYIIVKDGALSLAVKAERGSLYAFRSDTNLTNFYLETTANVGLCKGNDQLGVLFRVNGSQSFYRLLINCLGQVSLQQVAGGTPVVLVDWTSGSLPPGLYQPITIGIWQSSSKMRIYLNGQLQFEASSDYFRSGGIGFYAHADADNPLTVNFTSLNVFDVPRTSAATPTP